MSEINNQNPELVISGKVFNSTFPITENITEEPTLEMIQEYYLLCEADYLRIKNVFQDLSSYILGIFSASVGMTIIWLAKLFQVYVMGITLAIDTYEWLAPLIGFFISLALLIICRFVPNEKKQVMNAIKDHFYKAPRKKQAGKR